MAGFIVLQMHPNCTTNPHTRVGGLGPSVASQRTACHRISQQTWAGTAGSHQGRRRTLRKPNPRHRARMRRGESDMSTLAAIGCFGSAMVFLSLFFPFYSQWLVVTNRFYYLEMLKNAWVNAGLVVSLLAFAPLLQLGAPFWLLDSSSHKNAFSFWRWGGTSGLLLFVLFSAGINQEESARFWFDPRASSLEVGAWLFAVGSLVGAIAGYFALALSKE